MANPFVHVELATRDLETSKKFYAALFAWKLEEMPGMDYTLIKVGEGTGGGMMKKPDPAIPDLWLPYILVDDVAASTKKAKALGATLAKEVPRFRAWGGSAWWSIPTARPLGSGSPKQAGEGVKDPVLEPKVGPPRGRNSANRHFWK